MMTDTTLNSLSAPMSIIPLQGHKAENFHVEGYGQVQIGDRHYYGSQ